MLKHLCIGLILVMTLNVGAVMAQDVPADAEAWVQLFADLREAGNYTFERTEYMTQTYTNSEGVDIEYRVIEGLATGEMLSEDTFTQHRESTVTSGSQTATYTVEVRQIDEALFVQIDLGGAYAAPVPLEGWWRAEDLINASPDGTWQVLAQSLIDFTSPLAFVDDPRLILSITEEAPETLNGLDLQVFTIEIDQLTAMFLESVNSLEEALAMMEQDKEFTAAITMTLSYTVWVNPEDGRIYRLDSTFSQFLPYTLSQPSHFDITVSGEGQTVFTYPEEALVIEAPLVTESE
jgi:hypothetical protein